MKTFLKVAIALIFVISAAAGIAVLFDIDLPMFDFTKSTGTEAPSLNQTEAPSGVHTETPSESDTDAVCSHDYETVIVSATCEDDGSTIMTCKLCGKQNVTRVAAFGHTFEGGDFCLTCGAVREYYVDPSSCSHSFGAAAGYERHVSCSLCDSGKLLTGIWYGNDTISIPQGQHHIPISFESNGFSYSYIILNRDGEEDTIWYHNGGDTVVKVYDHGSWFVDNAEYVSLEYEVTLEPAYFNWFIFNFSHSGEA